ncbi:MAG: hypothetical protein ACE5FV_04015 [Woeseia sp.]
MLRLRQILRLAVASAVLTVPATAEDNGLDVHEDYYRGFAQGAYYGLMLAGEDYHVAWCMKVELEYETKEMGTGADFQRRMEALLEKCREENS